MTGKGSKERVLSPTKVTAWLDCAHYLNLSHQATCFFINCNYYNKHTVC